MLRFVILSFLGGGRFWGSVTFAVLNVHAKPGVTKYYFFKELPGFLKFRTCLLFRVRALVQERTLISRIDLSYH